MNFKMRECKKLNARIGIVATEAFELPCLKIEINNDWSEFLGEDYMVQVIADRRMQTTKEFFPED